MTLLPLFPLELVLFPGEKLPLHIFEERYKELIRHCLSKDRPFGIPAYINQSISLTGCMARIDAVVKEYDNGEMDIITTGTHRYLTRSFDDTRSYLQGNIVTLKDDQEDNALSAELLAEIEPLLKQLIKLAGQKDAPELDRKASNAFEMAHFVGFDISQKQQLLEMNSETGRLTFILKHLKETLPKIRSFYDVKQRIKSNGHFKQFPPIQFNPGSE